MAKRGKRPKEATSEASPRPSHMDVDTTGVSPHPPRIEAGSAEEPSHMEIDPIEGPSRSSQPTTPSTSTPASPLAPSSSEPGRPTLTSLADDEEKEVVSALNCNRFFVLGHLRDKFFARVNEEYLSKRDADMTPKLVPLACRYLHELFQDRPGVGMELCEHMRRAATKIEIMPRAFKCSLEPAPASVSGVSLATSSQSFVVSYENVYGNLQRAVTYFNRCSRETMLFYSKSCAIIQSSCSGKSRLVLSLAKSIPTLYICQRVKNEEGYPPGTPPIVKNFKIGIPSEAIAVGKLDLFMYARCVAFFHTAYYYNVTVQRFYMEAKGSNADPDAAKRLLLDYMRLQYTESFWKELWEAVKRKEVELWERIKKVDADPEMKKYWTKIEDEMRPIIAQDVKPTIPCEPQLLLTWMVCIDEARHFNETLLGCSYDILTHLLRAARLLPPGAVLLYMDTLSELNVLFPYTVFASERMRATGTQMGVHTDLTTWNIGACKYKSQIPKTIHDTVKMAYMSLYGRPYWFSLRETGDLTGILPAATAKLCGTPSIPDSKEVSNLACFAVLASLVSLDVNPAFRFSTELVGSHLGYLDCYNQEMGPRNLFVTYPSDPVVSAAAFAALRLSPWILAPALNMLMTHAQWQMVAPGERGELVAQILCILAMERITGPHQKVVNVGSFLASLCGNAYVEHISKEMSETMRDILLNGLLNFSHFAKITGFTPNRGDMTEFVRRRIAIVCKRGQSGIDLIIPLVLPKAFPKPISPPPTAIKLGGQGMQVDVQPNKGPAETKTETETETDAAIPVEPESIDCPWAAMNLVNQVNRLRATTADYLDDEVHRNPYNPVITGHSAGGRASSSSSVGATAPVQHKGNNGKEEETSFPIDAAHISYILIQCKNYRSGSRFTEKYELFNPFDTKIESGGPPSTSSKSSVPKGDQGGSRDKVSEIPRLYPQENRPYVALGLFFNNEASCEFKELVTYPDNSSYNKDFISFALVNGHRLLPPIPTIRGGAVEQMNVGEVLDKILSVYSGTLDYVKIGGNAIVKSAQMFGYRGSSMDVDPFDVAPWTNMDR